MSSGNICINMVIFHTWSSPDTCPNLTKSESNIYIWLDKHPRQKSTNWRSHFCPLYQDSPRYERGLDSRVYTYIESLLYMHMI